MTFAISFGGYGGFYVGAWRICLGWVALTFFPHDIDDLLVAALDAPPAQNGDAA